MIPTSQRACDGQSKVVCMNAHLMSYEVGCYKCHLPEIDKRPLLLRHERYQYWLPRDHKTGSRAEVRLPSSEAHCAQKASEIKRRGGSLSLNMVHPRLPPQAASSGDIRPQEAP